MMTLAQFAATGRDCDDLGVTLSDELLAGVPGRVYLDALHIIRSFSSEGSWCLPIANVQRVTDNLPRLEAILYEFALSEGYLEDVR